MPYGGVLICRIEETITGQWGNPDHPSSLALGGFREVLHRCRQGKSLDARLSQDMTFLRVWVVRLEI